MVVGCLLGGLRVFILTCADISSALGSAIAPPIGGAICSAIRSATGSDMILALFSALDLVLGLGAIPQGVLSHDFNREKTAH